jgi:hypothetical protein
MRSCARSSGACSRSDLPLNPPPGGGREGGRPGRARRLGRSIPFRGTFVHLLRVELHACRRRPVSARGHVHPCLQAQCLRGDLPMGTCPARQPSPGLSWRVVVQRRPSPSSPAHVRARGGRCNRCGTRPTHTAAQTHGLCRRLRTPPWAGGRNLCCSRRDLSQREPHSPGGQRRAGARRGLVFDQSGTRTPW